MVKKNSIGVDTKKFRELLNNMEDFPKGKDLYLDEVPEGKHFDEIHIRKEEDVGYSIWLTDLDIDSWERGRGLKKIREDLHDVHDVEDIVGFLKKNKVKRIGLPKTVGRI